MKKKRPKMIILIKFRPFQSILKAYLHGVWDSVKGVSLIFIVIRDTYSNKATLQNDKQDSELDESSSSSNSAHTNKRPPPSKRSHASRRELNKLKEYVSICNVIHQPNN